MIKKPKTTNEHIISIYGFITGLKKEVNIIKTNHLKHLHEDVNKLDEKLDKRFDTVINWLVYGSRWCYYIAYNAITLQYI
jgi:hypothetical protein